MILGHIKIMILLQICAIIAFISYSFKIIKYLIALYKVFIQNEDLKIPNMTLINLKQALIWSWIEHTAIYYVIIYVLLLSYG
jgi:hypothetical protein